MSDQTVAAAGSVTTTFHVDGMTCGHCVAAVSGELRDTVAGVKDVQVDLPSGQVVVTSDQPLEQAAITAAVDEAGYQLTPGSLH